jgi:zinc/manganese transport system ATP-binding protein
VSTAAEPTGDERASQQPVAVALQDAAVVRNGQPVWDKGNLQIPAGAIVGVIGPNGSGKTTLLKVLLGLLPISAGSVEVLGAAPRRGDRRIGYVPQHYVAATGEAVRAIDLVGLGISGRRWGTGRLSAAEQDQVRAALAAVDATSLANRRMSQLSGGQQQRIAIAQALVDEPELLLLDEPLANLDQRNQREIVELLGELGERRSVTILVVVHDLNPLLSILTSAVYLLDGHPHYGRIGEIVDAELLSHLYGTSIKVIRTPQGDLFTRSA